MINAKINGLNELLGNVQELKDVSEKAVAASLAQIAMEIAEDAKQNHSFQNRTGNLEASIQPLPVEMKGKRFSQIVRAGMSYAVYVEKGTEKNNPHPFMGPALERNKTNIPKTISATIRAGIEEVCK